VLSWEYNGTTFNPLHRLTQSAIIHIVRNRQTDDSIMLLLI